MPRSHLVAQAERIQIAYRDCLGEAVRSEAHGIQKRNQEFRWAEIGESKWKKDMSQLGIQHYLTLLHTVSYWISWIAKAETIEVVWKIKFQRCSMSQMSHAQLACLWLLGQKILAVHFTIFHSFHNFDSFHTVSQYVAPSKNLFHTIWPLRIPVDAFWNRTLSSPPPSYHCTGLPKRRISSSSKNKRVWTR